MKINISIISILSFLLFSGLSFSESQKTDNKICEIKNLTLKAQAFIKKAVSQRKQEGYFNVYKVFAPSHSLLVSDHYSYMYVDYRVLLGLMESHKVTQKEAELLYNMVKIDHFKALTHYVTHCSHKKDYIALAQFYVEKENRLAQKLKSYNTKHFTGEKFYFKLNNDIEEKALSIRVFTLDSKEKIVKRRNFYNQAKAHLAHQLNSFSSHLQTLQASPRIAIKKPNPNKPKGSTAK